MPTATRKRSSRKATTSASRKTSPASSGEKRLSAKDAAVRVLKREGGPLKATVIAERVLATKGVKLAGKTPAATIAAMLSVENQKSDGLFVRTEPGTYALREAKPKKEPEAEAATSES